MSQFLLVAAVALTIAALGFGIAVLFTGDDSGLRPVEPDGIAVPLPADRPLTERDLAGVRFDTALRGYRMAQVDAALRRAAYDLGYKEELINVLRAEVEALRAGRHSDAEVMRRARLAALAPVRLDPTPAPLPVSQPATTPEAAPAVARPGAAPTAASAVPTGEPEPEAGSVRPAAGDAADTGSEPA